MPLSSKKSKSNHMIQYYRRQSDKKMISTIINMKSQLKLNFSEQKSLSKGQLNNSKRQMIETTHKLKIHQENKKMVYRIKEARQKTVRDNQKYFDGSVCERLLKTRNLFRRRAKEDKQSKVSYENDLLMKRLLLTKSSYGGRLSPGKLQCGRSQKKLSAQKVPHHNWIQPNKLQWQQEIQLQLQLLQKKSTFKRSSMSHTRRSRTEQLQFRYGNRKFSHNNNNKSQTKLQRYNYHRQQEEYCVKNAQVDDRVMNEGQGQIDSNEDGGILVKKRDIKLEKVKKSQQRKVNPEDGGNVKRTTQTKGKWYNGGFSSYRIVV